MEGASHELAAELFSFNALLTGWALPPVPTGDEPDDASGCYANALATAVASGLEGFELIEGTMPLPFDAPDVWFPSGWVPVETLAWSSADSSEVERAAMEDAAVCQTVLDALLEGLPERRKGRPAQLPGIMEHGDCAGDLEASTTACSSSASPSPTTVYCESSVRQAVADSVTSEVTAVDKDSVEQDQEAGASTEAGSTSDQTELTATTEHSCAASSEGCASEGRRRSRGKLRAQESLSTAERNTGFAAGTGEDPFDNPQKTTVMLRNIPNKYSREMLVRELNKHFRGQFDFVYLPIDFKNKCNVGYGFINFRGAAARRQFVDRFDGAEVCKCLPGLNSRKVVEVTPARVHGLEENVRRLSISPVMNELANHPEWMPLLLDEQGNEKPFPMPDEWPQKQRKKNEDRRRQSFWDDSAASFRQGATKEAGGHEEPAPQVRRGKAFIRKRERQQAAPSPASGARKQRA